jgi:UDP-glucuronate 4-epimerase
MKVLVTGGAGFIGSHLCEHLLNRGDSVVALDCLNDYYSPAIKRKNIEPSLGNHRFRFVEGDILDEPLLKSLFDSSRFDVVVHLAARAGVRPSLVDPLLYEQVNCRGTLNILEQMKEKKIKRLVFASSSSVYGNTKTIPFSEDVKIDRPVSPYAATKAAGELYCHNYFHLYGISANCLRFFTVYGPRQRPDMAINKFTRLIDRGGKVPFYGDGSTKRDYTFYTDIIQGVVASIDRDLGFEIFNLGESATTTLAELVAQIERALGKKANLDRQPMQPGDVEMTCADISKARKLLDYNPTTPVSEGVPRFVEWYREHAGLFA